MASTFQKRGGGVVVRMVSKIRIGRTPCLMLSFSLLTQTALGLVLPRLLNAHM
ncbi:hypothetical protein K474DRAFT_946386 [Panus rudis PR-1116 ss-1]|nr:hypothetical protein K474DRAFT_946386 [Panus rudis PR-1116 ss-1]